MRDVSIPRKNVVATVTEMQSLIPVRRTSAAASKQGVQGLRRHHKEYMAY